MSETLNPIGSIFDKVFGNNDKPNTGLDPKVAQQQAEMEAQQKAELEQQKKQLEQQRISMLRGRFSGSGNVPVDNTTNTDQDAANLFSRITGRTE